MHNLYLVMKQRDTPTDEEILMAAGRKPFDNSLQADYLKIIEAEAAGIKEAFEKQKAKSTVCNPYCYVGLIILDHFSSLRSLGTKINLNGF